MMISDTIPVIGIFGTWRKSDMKKKRVVILGTTGMLGSMLLDFFVKSGEFDIIATYRDQKVGKLLKDQYTKVDFRRFDAEKANPKSILDVIKSVEWVINAIGINKPYIHDDNAGEIERAILVNARFPYLLASAAKKTGSRVIQIATDCVYSGQKGHYIETDRHDALDIYGKTKSFGEVGSNRVYHLRCSIIGPQLKEYNSLMDWFLNQPKSAVVNGFTNHQWNGITTLHFARICRGIIKKGAKLASLQHIVPADSVDKASLLKNIAKTFKRGDIVLKRVKTRLAVDRTLSTNNIKLNQTLWQLGGYDAPPSIQNMVSELSQYKSYWKETQK